MTHRTARFVIGPLLLAAVVGVFVLDERSGETRFTSALALALGAGALIEYRRMLGERLPGSVGTGLVVSGFLALLLVSSFGASLASFPVLLAIIPLVVVPVLMLMRLRWSAGVRSDDLSTLGAITLGWLLVVAPAGYLLAALQLPHGVLWTVVIVIGSKLNDIGGYLVGSAVGRHKLCPGISPNKSIEGSLGGLLLGVGGTVWLVTFLDPISDRVTVVQGTALGLLLGLATQFGDLLESLMKRAAGVKDSGALIPAFGGILDLVDSLILAAPVGYAMGHLWLG